MSKRNLAILAILRSNGMFGVTASYIASSIDAPEPSVRRSIQTLIRNGWNISYAADGVYRFREGY